MTCYIPHNAWCFSCCVPNADRMLQVEAQLKAHLKNVRALDYNSTTNELVTCSFDKTVKVFS